MTSFKTAAPELVVGADWMGCSPSHKHKQKQTGTLSEYGMRSTTYSTFDSYVTSSNEQLSIKKTLCRTVAVIIWSHCEWLGLVNVSLSSLIVGCATGSECIYAVVLRVLSVQIPHFLLLCRLVFLMLHDADGLRHHLFKITKKVKPVTSELIIFPRDGCYSSWRVIF